MQECHYEGKMAQVMILVGAEFVSARMSLWWKNDQDYDTGGMRVCKCKNVIMTKNDQGYDTSGIRICKCKKVVMI